MRLLLTPTFVNVYSVGAGGILPQVGRKGVQPPGGGLDEEQTGLPKLLRPCLSEMYQVPDVTF